MPCEKYRKALREAAAAGDTYELSTGLRAHLAACGACRAFWSEEQQLLAAIDAGVRQTANAEVPASLLPRVRADFETPTNRRSRWMPMLVFASAGVAMAATVFAIVRSHESAPEDQIKQIAAAPVREATPVSAGPSGTPRAEAIPPHRSNQPRRGTNSDAQQSASFGRIEVRVPPEERDALARFITARQEESDFAVLLAAPTPDWVNEPMSVAPLEIADLEVRPLDRLGSEVPDSRNENR